MSVLGKVRADRKVLYSWFERGLFGLLLALSSTSATAASQPHSLQLGEGFENPLGFHDATPTFSWKLPVGVRDQTAYQVRMASTVEKLSAGPDLWDSGKVESSRSIWVSYEGQPLTSRQCAYWQVRYWGPAGRVSEWSGAARVEMGLLGADAWKAKWIRSDSEPSAAQERVSWLRREFTLREEVKSARLYVTARGLFEAHLNGVKVGTAFLAPGWTSYGQRLETLTYDVTDGLRTGGNVLGVLLGTGWYAGRIGWKDEKNLFGDRPELLLQLEVTYQDGSRESVLSDEQWKASWDGPIRSSSLYDGEAYDARREMPGWDEQGFEDAEWGGVVATSELGAARLVPKSFAPIRATERLNTRAITEPEPGRYVFDLGQNMVGFAALDIPVEKDRTVTLRFAEMLQSDGTLYTENYRSAKSVDTYTAAATGRMTWSPVFTFHGFRYVELSGLPDTAQPETGWVTGVVLRSDLSPIGTFTSSHAKLNQLQSNIVWGQRGNFVDIPTDCPQRDERMGWTGDAQVFCPTAMFNYDTHGFWKSWLDSMRDDQLPDGRIPHVIPAVLGGGSPGWMDAATIIPWEVYVRTGDREVLTENFAMMERLVRWYRRQATNGLIQKIGGFGDWLQPHAKDQKGDTPLPLLGTAFYAHSCQILAHSARVLGRTDMAERAEAEAASIRQAFTQHYFDAEGNVRNSPETQTAYLLAIGMDLLPADLQPKAAAHFVDLVHAADGHLRTGFLGTPFVTSVLDKVGQPELARSILFKETYPSWFFSINQGATTLWERWNSYSHQDGFGKASMNSFNHYAYGAIGQWMYERIAGLAPDPARPGYKHIIIRPLVGGPLTSACAELETPYGKAVSGWEIRGDRLLMDVTVPPNSSATLIFPQDRTPEEVSAGTYHYAMPWVGPESSYSSCLARASPLRHCAMAGPWHASCEGQRMGERSASH